MAARELPDRFQVAFSFAGEQRDLVRAIALAVERALGNGTVFLDEWFEYYIAGDDADLRLQSIYGRRSDLVVPCVSAHYGAKPWTKAEHRAIRARQMELSASRDQRDSLRTLPIRVGDGEIDGVLFNTIVPDARDRPPNATAQLILDRLRLLLDRSLTLDPGEAPKPDRPPMELLVEAAQRDRLVVLLGDVLDPTVAFSRHALAEQLASQASIPLPDFFVAGSVLETIFGRAALRDRVLAQLLAVKGSPTAPYQDLARVPISTVVSLFPDPVLELALTTQDAAYRSIVSDDDQAVHELEPGARELYLLGGSARFGTGLLLTQEDYEGALSQVTYLTRGLMRRLAMRSILLLGCDLADTRFRKLFYWITKHRTRKDGDIFVAADSAPATFWSQWAPITIDLSPGDILRALSTGMRTYSRTSQSPPQVRLPAHQPYKYLDYYDDTDTQIFFGRDADTADIVNEILSASRRVTILCGRSGVGKTSIVRAGILPLLSREYGMTVWYARCGVDPVASIVDVVRAQAQSQAVASKRSLVEALHQAYADAPRPQLVCVDQFEEAFIKLGPDVLLSFATALEAAIAAPDTETRFLIAIREDFLSRLAGLGTVVSGILENTYRLDDLSRENAYLAITKPAQLCGVRVEEGLADAILDDLHATAVLPAHLQVICDRVLSDSDTSGGMTLSSYRRLGRASGILAGHLERALQDMPRELDPAARSVLSALVTSEHTKDLLTIDEVASRTALSHDLVMRVTFDLIHRCRLVREVQGTRGGFELSHESLATSAAAWLDQVQAQTRAAQALLDREVNSASRFTGHIIDRSRLRVLEDHRSTLYITPAAVSLIVASYTVLGDVPTTWRAALNELAMDQISEAVFYRPLRHDPGALGDLLRSDTYRVAGEWPVDIDQIVTRWLATVDFDVLLHALPLLAPLPSGVGSCLIARADEWSRSQLQQLIAETPYLCETLAATVAASGQDAAGVRSIPVVISTLLSSRGSSTMSPETHANLWTALRAAMEFATGNQRDLAHAEAAQLAVGPVLIPQRPSILTLIDPDAVLRVAESSGDLSRSSVAYLFAVGATSQVERILTRVSRYDEDARRLLVSCVVGSGSFGWRLLEAALRNKPDEALANLSCDAVEADSSGAFSAPVSFLTALLAEIPSAEHPLFMRLAGIVALRDEDSWTTTYLSHFPGLSHAVAASLLKVQWRDVGWVLAVLLAQRHSGNLKATLRSKLPASLATLSMKAMVAFMAQGSDLGYTVAVELGLGNAARSAEDRESLLGAMRDPQNADGSVRSVVWKISRAAVSGEGRDSAAVRESLMRLLSDPDHLHEQQYGPEEARLIAEAVHEALIKTGALSTMSEDVRSACYRALARFRGQRPETEHLLGRMCAADTAAATYLLECGHTSAREGVLDGLLETPGPPEKALLAALRSVAIRGVRANKRKASALLARNGGVADLRRVAVVLSPSRRTSLSASQVSMYRNEVLRALRYIVTTDLRGLMSDKFLTPMVLLEVVGNRPELLLEETVLAWAMRALSDLPGAEASALRRQLRDTAPALENHLRRLVEHGNRGQRQQAKLILDETLDMNQR